MFFYSITVSFLFPVKYLTIHHLPANPPDTVLLPMYPSLSKQTEIVQQDITILVSHWLLHPRIMARSKCACLWWLSFLDSLCPFDQMQWFIKNTSFDTLSHSLGLSNYSSSICTAPAWMSPIGIRVSFIKQNHFNLSLFIYISTNTSSLSLSLHALKFNDSCPYKGSIA